ncbi:MAG: hypothetical protein U1E36_08340 [Rickettsiales bacterium]
MPQKTPSSPKKKPKVHHDLPHDIQEWVDRQRSVIKENFLHTNKASDCLLAQSDLVDELLLGLPSGNKSTSQNVALVAVGGYGRRDLFPHSDVDLMFLHSEEKDTVETYAQKILYPLWDLKLKVGHAVRTIEETIIACQDHTVLTALLDARFITGDKKLFSKFQKEFDAVKKKAGDYTFVRQKLDERKTRHQTWGDSRYLLEPNVKEGKGGLRDLHTLYWLARYCYDIKGVRDLPELGIFTKEELQDFKRAENFLSIVRIHLHYLNERSDDRLTFDAQCRIASSLGFRGADSNQAVERFMKRYFQVAGTVGRLTRQFCATLEADKNARQSFHKRKLKLSRRILRHSFLKANGLPFQKQRIILSIHF